MRALLANVSHDLKTPMTSITGYAQALTDGTADPQQAGHVGEVIKSEAEHVNRLLADLLYLGEIDAGQVITRREDLPLEDLVERSLRHIEPQAAARDVSLNVDVAPEATLHNVDPDKLERAFTNILENAAKFSPEGGDVLVTGAVENGVAPPHVVFAVTNSSPPIPDDDLPRVFDRFFRGDRSRRIGERQRPRARHHTRVGRAQRGYHRGPQRRRHRHVQDHPPRLPGLIRHPARCEWTAGGLGPPSRGPENPVTPVAQAGRLGVE